MLAVRSANPIRCSSEHEGGTCHSTHEWVSDHLHFSSESEALPWFSSGDHCRRGPERSFVCRSYAMAIADVLDPDGRLFGPRIIAQGAGDSAAVVDLAKRLQAGLEGREMVSIVVDDTSSV